MIRVICCAMICTMTSVATAQVVRFETNMGDIEVTLFADDAPATVANFLNYVQDGDYQNTIVHRSVPGFVIQGGGFATSSEILTTLDQIQPVETDPPVVNEPLIPNTRGTLAMAKFGGDPDSATNQWFFNLADNQSILENQNGGFTVFGETGAEGLVVIDAIADLPVNDLDGGLFSETPLITNGTVNDQLVVIRNIRVVPEPTAGLLWVFATLAFIGRQRIRNADSV